MLGPFTALLTLVVFGPVAASVGAVLYAALACVRWYRRPRPPRLATRVSFHGSTPMGDLHDFLRSGGVIMVYGDGCVHCDRMKPEYAAAAEQRPRKFATFRAEKCEAMDVLGVRWLPTIVGMRDERLVHFDGSRDARGLLEFQSTLSRAD